MGLVFFRYGRRIHISATPKKIIYWDKGRIQDEKCVSLTDNVDNKLTHSITHVVTDGYLTAIVKFEQLDTSANIYFRF